MLTLFAARALTLSETQALLGGANFVLEVLVAAGFLTEAIAQTGKVNVQDLSTGN